MKNKLLKNCFIIDPVSEKELKGDILIEGAVIKKVGTFSYESEEVQEYDLEGKIVTPGLMDMHVHLREPGEEDRETIATGTKAAASGGFTALCSMPDTNPPADNEATLYYVKEKAEREGNCKVYPIGCLTKGRKGEEMAEYGILKEAGAVALSDGDSPVMNSEVMRRCLEYASLYDMVVLSHCEDKNMTADGQMHEGFQSTVLGLKGIPAAAEEIIVARDIRLAELAGARLHITHLSTVGGIELVRRAKERGVKVTAEVSPYYFSLSDEAVTGYNTATKLNPPLRSEAHIDAILKGLQDGTVDVIASDHSPYTREDKEVEFMYAPFGASGLESCLALSIHHLYHGGKLTLKELLKKFTTGPASVLGTEIVGIREEAPANLTVIDLEKTKKVDPHKWYSLGKNTPVSGMELKGWPIMTVYNGVIVAQD